MVDKTLKLKKKRLKELNRLLNVDGGENRSEIDILSQRVVSEAPLCSAALLTNPGLVAGKKDSRPKLFKDLPISQKTLEGLNALNFMKMTEIQKCSIPHALVERDILGAAKTGSGKTLAFLIPVLENLFRKKWGRDDGLGAILISPTRELSLQIFEVLKSIGKNHSFSAGLIIGGFYKGIDLEREKSRISNLNILICTPGRLLQHMDETPSFCTDNVQILVLDEADRLLGHGFEKELKAIVQNLPKTRQTMLFSATQTNSVKSLAKISLVSPEFVAPHEESSKATPSKLLQQYIVVEAHDKIPMLFSFLCTHMASKVLVFVTTRKQAQFLFEVLRRLRPGILLSCVHGKQTQNKRIRSYEAFQARKSGCLVTTDVCSRGLDIKNVEWVISFDCPENVKEYIHRVGRTARYKANGSALLFLLPSEAGMAEKIRAAKVPMAKVKPKKQLPVNLSSKIASFLAESEGLKHTAQKAFSCYVRAIAKRSDKSVFDIMKIDLDALCKSMGLLSKPVLNFATAKEARLDSFSLKALLRSGTKVTKRKAKLVEGDSEADKLLAKKTRVGEKEKLGMFEEQDREDFFTAKVECNEKKTCEDEKAKKDGERADHKEEKMKTKKEKKNSKKSRKEKKSKKKSSLDFLSQK